MPEFMHAIEQGISHQPDAGSLVQLQRKLGHHRLSGLGSLRRLLEEGVFPELVVLGKGEDGSDQGRRQNKIFGIHARKVGKQLNRKAYLETRVKV